MVTGRVTFGHLLDTSVDVWREKSARWKSNRHTLVQTLATPLRLSSLLVPIISIQLKLVTKYMSMSLGNKNN